MDHSGFVQESIASERLTMVSTRGKKDLPPRSPQAQHSRSSRRTGAAASVASSRRSRASSVASGASSASRLSDLSEQSEFETDEEIDEEEEADGDEDIPPQSVEFQPPPPSVHSQRPSKVSSAASVSSTGSKREPLDLSIEKQVLKDIEAEGGLRVFEQGKSHALSQLLDKEERERAYGKRGSSIRKKISRRVRYLKKLPYSQYTSLLNGYGIEPAKLSKKQIEQIRKEESTRPKSVQTKRVKKEEGLSDLEEEDDQQVFPEPVTSSSSTKSSQRTGKPSSIKPEPVISSSVSRNSKAATAAAASSSEPVPHIIPIPTITMAGMFAMFEFYLFAYLC